MPGPANYPAPGCIVEYLEDNAIQIAMVMEDTGGKLRLLLPSRRETKLAANRMLPWLGPLYPATTGREDAVRLLEQHKSQREEKLKSINLMELWELAQGEVESASAVWFAGLVETGEDIDAIASYGRALLGCKSHFRFQSPDFLVYDAETVEKRLAETRARAEREALVEGGSAFLRFLWEIASRQKPAPADFSSCKLVPPENVAARIKNLLYQRMINPDSQEDVSLWQMVSKGLPEVPHLPYQLLCAWGILPQHFNFWLVRAGYDGGDTWWKDAAELVDTMAATGRCHSSIANSLEICTLPFISIDNKKTFDIDDAFHIEKRDECLHLTIALAAPALGWPFGSSLDADVLQRGTSIYLPEGDLHMLPEVLGTDALSLVANEQRPALCLELVLDKNGEQLDCRPFLARVQLAANLNYDDVQAVLNGEAEKDNPALPFQEKLELADNLAEKLELARIARGAIIMRRPEPELRITDTDGKLIVELIRDASGMESHRLVSEMMVLASSAIALWAQGKKIPLIHRTQNVSVPREYGGIWSKPEEISKIMRSLIPSILEVEPAPHAALAVPNYAPITSPLRRYADLINEAQVIGQLINGNPIWNGNELVSLLEKLSISLDGASQVQRFRPRYWKLLYFRQQGDKVWWRGVITEENENFVSVSLPEEGLFVRGRRQLFDESTAPGQPVRLRLGKINPLYNEVHILEVMPED